METAELETEWSGKYPYLVLAFLWRRGETRYGPLQEHSPPLLTMQGMQPPQSKSTSTVPTIVFLDQTTTRWDQR